MTQGILASRAMNATIRERLEGFVGLGLFYETRHNNPSGTYQAGALEAYIRQTGELPFGPKYEQNGPRELVQLADDLRDFMEGNKGDVVVLKADFPERVQDLEQLTNNYNVYEIFVKEEILVP